MPQQPSPSTQFGPDRGGVIDDRLAVLHRRPARRLGHRGGEQWRLRFELDSEIACVSRAAPARPCPMRRRSTRRAVCAAPSFVVGAGFPRTWVQSPSCSPVRFSSATSRSRTVSEVSVTSWEAHWSAAPRTPGALCRRWQAPGWARRRTLPSNGVMTDGSGPRMRAGGTVDAVDGRRRSGAVGRARAAGEQVHGAEDRGEQFGFASAPRIGCLYGSDSCRASESVAGCRGSSSIASVGWRRDRCHSRCGT